MPNTGSSTADRTSVRETMSYADKLEKIKSDLDNSLLIQELKDKHGWDIRTSARNNCVSVNMKKQGPLDSTIAVTFTIADMRDVEFEKLYDGFRQLCFYPNGEKERDKCVMAAIQSNIYEASASADDVHMIHFTLDFSDSKEKTEGMSVKDVTEAIRDAGAEISAVGDCLFAEQYDRPEMKEIEDFLTENGIPFTRDIELQNCWNELIVDDDDLDLHFSVEAESGDNRFVLKSGLQFKEHGIFDAHYVSVSSEEIINRLKSVENETGEYQDPNDRLCLKVYSYVNDGENDYAIIGPNRNEALPCPFINDGEGTPGYLYGNTFVPVDEIKEIQSPEHTYAEQKGVLKDAESEQKNNVRFDTVIGSRLDEMDRKRPKINAEHNAVKTKGNEGPGGRD